MTPLRFGFVLSGALHVAVVAAFSQSSEVEIPAVDEPRPLTLQLAMFKPAQAAQPQPAPSEPEPPPPPVPEVVEPEPPPAEVVKVEPEESPPPGVKQVRPEPAPVQEPPKVTPRPVAKKPPRPKQNKKPRPRVATPAPPTVPKVKLAAVSRPQPVVPAVDAREKQHYLAALAAQINRRKYYPASSRRRGEEGRVMVRFVIRKDGELTELSVAESSGSRRLDAAALKTLRRVSPFRPIPDALDRDQWAISVPIAFSLRH